MQHVRLNLVGKFKVADIRTAIERNKTAHQKDYAEAVEAYFEELDRQIEKLKKNLSDRKYDNLVNMTKPKDETRKYDELLEYFKLVQDEVVELSKEDYDTLVNDKTEWAISASATNAMYKSR